MSPDILSKIKEKLINSLTSQTEKPLINKKRMSLLIESLSRYSKGETLYPGILIRKLNISMKEAYQILELIQSMGIIQRNYEVHCSSCQKYTGDIYETIGEIPIDYSCEECGNEIGLNPMENTIVVYRVLVD